MKKREIKRSDGLSALCGMITFLTTWYLVLTGLWTVWFGLLCVTILMLDFVRVREMSGWFHPQLNH